MPTLSLAMIVRNEERTLARVLGAARAFCDELIVVDTGSTDNTVEIARQHGARVEYFTWCDDFAAARNYSFTACTGDWIIWLDADDVLSAETVEIGRRIKAELLGQTDANLVRCPYEYSYGDDGKPTLIQGRERIVRRNCGLGWVGPIHEVITGPKDALTWVTCPEFVVEHRTADENKLRKEGRNLRIYEKTLDLETCDTRDLYLYAGELRGAGREKDAVPILDTYLKRWPKDAWDLFEEPYVARIDLLECLRRTGEWQAALRVAGDAVAYQGARAEAYALAGVIHYDQGNYAAAFPSFLAAAACKIPTHGGVVYTAFYGPAVHDMIKECKARLEGK